MATWYTTGTINVTNGSATVAGAGTLFSANVQIGDALHAPDGKVYEIVGVVSDTSLTVSPTYLGGTVSAQTFTVQPTRGWTKRVLDELDASNTDVTTMLAGPGAGKFPDGTLAQPGQRFAADEDTGMRRVSSNKLALVAGGADKLVLTGNTASGDVVQSSATDATVGKLMTVGAFGVGGSTGTNITDANSASLGGFYGIAEVSTSSNMPAGFANGPASLLTLTGQNANNLTQIITNQNATGTFIRHYRAAVWGSWTEFVMMDAAGDLNIGGGALFVDTSTKRVGFGLTAPIFKIDLLETAATNCMRLHNTHATFSSTIDIRQATRAASSAYNFGTWYSGVTSDLEFKFSGDGNGTCDGSWTGGGADYAEYFEWLDGNPMAEDRRGISVVLDGDKIREALAGEEPIGVISGNPSVVGDAAPFRWKGKYLRDDFGSAVMEDYEAISWTETVTETETVIEQATEAQEYTETVVVITNGAAVQSTVTKTRDVPLFDEYPLTDAAGNDLGIHREPRMVEVARETTKEVEHSYAMDEVPAGLTVPVDAVRVSQTRRKLNPVFTPGTDYTPREDRPEWDTVGLMGKLRVIDGQVTGAGWVKMRDVSVTVAEWLVK